MNVLNYEFEYVCEIILDVKNGDIYRYNPKNKYNNENEIELNKYGNNMFCKFKIPSHIKSEGVYCITSDSEIVYIGECINLSKRYNSGYGNISPRNCYKGGQSTNCKVNSNILINIEKGNRISLFFFKTKERHKVELEVINEINPKWNTKSKNINQVKRKNTSNISINTKTKREYGKHHNLYLFLNSKKDKYVQLSYESIDTLVNKLPKSAYQHKAWWSNGNNSHKHAMAWQDANYKVNKVVLGKYVVFIKTFN